MIDQTALNGRTPHDGRFAPGNRAAAGRSSRASELRKAFQEAITPEDIQAIATALVKSAKDGDIAAAKLILDRCCGKADPVADEVANRDRENSISNILALAERVRDERQANNADA